MRTLLFIFLLSLLPALTLGTAANAQTTWYSSYDAALEDIAAGRWEDAVEHLNQSLAIKPVPELNARTYGVWRKDYLPLYNLGLAYFNMGEYQRALEYFKRSVDAGAITRQPELLDQLQSYKQTAEVRVQIESPEMEISRMIEQELNKGQQLERQGELEEARILFQSVLSLDSTNALATAHIRDIEEKLARLQAQQDRQRQMEALVDSGRAELAAGRGQEALDVFNRVLGLDPSNQRAAALGDSARSQIAGREAQLERRDRQVEQLIEEGNTLASEGELEKASQTMRKALSLDPANQHTARMVARVDSLLDAKRVATLRERLLTEAVRLVGRDSLLAARDSLNRARQLGPDTQIDSLLNAIEQRMNDTERRIRLRDIPQLVVSGTADSMVVVHSSAYPVSGSAIDEDGILRIVLDINGLSTDLYRFDGGGQAPIRQNFEYTVELLPGINRVKLTVFDGRGVNSVALRTLNYDPPFWKHTLVRYLMALVLILGTAGAYYVRRNTFHLMFNKLRRRPFVQISPNPYIVGNPIRSREMFFGREDDFRFVKNKVDNEKYGSLIVLFGERRAGKTSVLYQILGGRLGPTYLPVFLDMQAMAVNNDSEFLGRVAEITADQLGARIGKTDLSQFEDHARNPYPLFEKFVDHVLESIGEDKLLFLVDEYELIEDKVIDGKLRKEIFHFFSGLVEHKPGLFLIFAGNHRLQDRRHSFWEPLLQRCDYRNISYLTPNDTRRLIQEPVRGKVYFIGTTVRDIMRLTAGQPFYTQLVCRNMVELLNDERRNFFYEEDISDVVREIIDNPPPQLIYFWAGMDTLEKLVLSTVSEAARHSGSFPDLGEMRHALKKYSAELPEDELKKVCERMTVREVLERGPRESYRFRMDLYRLWIREEHHLYSVAREFIREISPVNR